jgi:hypothetical protein
MVRGDIGRFGVTGSSWLSWQLVPAIAPCPRTVGFNSGTVDASGLDLLIHGPLLAITVKFRTSSIQPIPIRDEES